MKAFVAAIIGLLLVLAMIPAATASETVNVGNYSFMFDMAVPHEIIQKTTSMMRHDVVIKTFDGAISLSDLSYADLSWDQTVIPGSIDLGAFDKKEAGEEQRGLVVVVSKSTPSAAPCFEGIFEDVHGPQVDIRSSLNLTQSIDFFKNVKIGRIQSEDIPLKYRYRST